MKQTRKIYTIGGPCNYSNWMEGVNTQKMEDADLVLLTGGEDVSPKLYGDPVHPTTNFNTHRDEYEVQLAKKAMSLGKKIIGICRGCQLLTALAGGRLIQHQSGQGFIHNMETYDGQVIKTTSMHHQASYPWGMPEEDYRILAVTRGLSTFHKMGDDTEGVIGVVEGGLEIEAIYFPKIKGLGFQGHMELLSGNDLNWYRKNLDLFMDGQGAFA